MRQLTALADELVSKAFLFVPATLTCPLLGDSASADWPAFAQSWDRLELDTYMGDGGRYRRRRYATLAAIAHSADLQTQPHQPHYQSLDYNRLNGGIARHFAPVEDAVLAGPAMQASLSAGLVIFQALHPGRAAHIEVHQFRIEARAGALGQPTPEGKHRDGVDFVLVMMVRRSNVARGTTEIFDTAGARIDSFTLTEPGDMALVDDHRALHGVTPVSPVDATRPAWRDVLVATYRAAGERSAS